MTTGFPLDGACACGAVRYRMTTAPLFVNCCHCTWCQRETGSAFAVNAMIETDRVELLQGTPKTILTPSASGKGQHVVRCPDCAVALWSHYAGSGAFIAFVRTGSLARPSQCAPDAHIFISTKLPWVTLADGKPQFEGYLDPRRDWPAESLARFKAARERAKGSPAS